MADRETLIKAFEEELETREFRKKAIRIFMNRVDGVSDWLDDMSEFMCEYANTITQASNEVSQIKSQMDARLYNICESIKYLAEAQGNSAEAASIFQKQYEEQKNSLTELSALCAKDNFLGYTGKLYGVESIRSKIINGLKSKHAVLISGVPGTGKTMIAKIIVNELVNGDVNRQETICFTSTTDYTDFMEGLTSGSDGKFRPHLGVFLTFLKKALEDPEHEYYLIIDEISRGNTEAVMGELMTALEARGSIVTLKSGLKIAVPKNLNIIATMNTLDESTKNLDRATKERFVAVQMLPCWGDAEFRADLMKALEGYSNKDAADGGFAEVAVAQELLSSLIDLMVKVNSVIVEGEHAIGDDRAIGTRIVSSIASGNIIENLITACENIIKDINERVNNTAVATDIKELKELREFKAKLKEAKKSMER